MPATYAPSHRGGSGPPLLCLHGFTDTWRTWELVLPALEREHDVLAPTLAGHAGGPAFEGDASDVALIDAAERAMGEAGFATAHIVGNSLGGYLALRLAARGRARSVVALAPAGGWADPQRSFPEVAAYFTTMLELVRQAAPHADAIVATPEGRRQATAYITTSFEHIPAELLAHQLRGAAQCEAAPMLEFARTNDWELEPERISCPVRFVWGTADRVLGWPDASPRYREQFPRADWVELDGIGHCPQLDVPTETAELILGLTRQSR